MPYVKTKKKGAKKQRIKRFMFVFLLCFLMAASVPFLTTVALKQPENALRWFAKQVFYKRVFDFQNPGSQMSLGAKGKEGRSQSVALKTGEGDDSLNPQFFENLIPPVNPIFTYMSIAAFLVLSGIAVRWYVFRRR